MSGRDAEFRNRVVYRLGYFDIEGNLHEVECYSGHRQMVSALEATCEARKAGGEPQSSVVLVYGVENVAPVVILTDTPAT